MSLLGKSVMRLVPAVLESLPKASQISSSLVGSRVLARHFNCLSTTSAFKIQQRNLLKTPCSCGCNGRHLQTQGRGLSSQRTAGSSEGRSSRYGGSSSSRYSSRGPGRATQHVAIGGGGSSGAAGGGRVSPESGGDHRHGGSRQQMAAGVEEIQLEDIGGQQSVVIHPTLRRL